MTRGAETAQEREAKVRLARELYLVQRGPKPGYQRAPFHPVIVCAHWAVAQWEAGATDALATVWNKCDVRGPSGWLLVRWRGLDVDYGHVVRLMPLPDGSAAAIVHDRTAAPWSLLPGAVWWSTTRRPPGWLTSHVAPPPDEFSHNSITMVERTLADRATYRCRLARRRW